VISCLDGPFYAGNKDRPKTPYPCNLKSTAVTLNLSRPIERARDFGSRGIDSKDEPLHLHAVTN
jgi:hypothetical protein